ncbi:MAG: amidohydrolase family protein [Desulfurococcaceae archaeon]
MERVKLVIIAHGAYFSPREVRILRDYGFGLCWCPSVDSWLMGMHWIGLTDVEGLKLGIGSDGGAWSRADLLYEVKVAKALGKAMSVSVTYFKAGLDSNTLLKMLTGSAGSLVGERIGRLEKGFAADIVVLDTAEIRNPSYTTP